ncbi:MAG: ferredoxin [Candidatus Nanoarchaeia archaeon]|nr:ferredoxin [Candidatus Nanoarchaeia archaeon]
MAKYQLEIKDGCIGCGNCQAVCPKTFVLKDGKSTLKKKIIDKITCEKEAAEQCPVKVIVIKETK